MNKQDLKKLGMLLISTQVSIEYGVGLSPNKFLQYALDDIKKALDILDKGCGEDA